MMNVDSVPRPTATRSVVAETAAMRAADASAADAREATPSVRSATKGAAAASVDELTAPLQDDERDAVLAVLYEGRTPGEAAAAAGVSPRRLAWAMQCDPVLIAEKPLLTAFLAEQVRGELLQIGTGRTDGKGRTAALQVVLKTLAAAVNEQAEHAAATAEREAVVLQEQLAAERSAHHQTRLNRGHDVLERLRGRTLPRPAATREAATPENSNASPTEPTNARSGEFLSEENSSPGAAVEAAAGSSVPSRSPERAKRRRWRATPDDAHTAAGDDEAMTPSAIRSR